jgi:hypothetical protein
MAQNPSKPKLRISPVPKQIPRSSSGAIPGAVPGCVLLFANENGLYDFRPFSSKSLSESWLRLVKEQDGFKDLEPLAVYLKEDKIQGTASRLEAIEYLLFVLNNNKEGLCAEIQHAIKMCDLQKDVK